MAGQVKVEINPQKRIRLSSVESIHGLIAVLETAKYRSFRTDVMCVRYSRTLDEMMLTLGDRIGIMSPKTLEKT